MAWTALSALSLVLVVAVGASKGLVNEKVSRKIDMSKNVVLITAEITLRNDGDNAVSKMELVFPPHSNIADIEVATKSNPLEVKAGSSSDKGDHYTVTLSPALPSGDTVKLMVLTSHTHVLQPFPEEITQSENQYMLYNGHLHFYSPYATETQTTDVLAPSATIESYTEESVSVKGSTLTYGPFKSIAPFSSAPLRIHAQHNYPFATLTDVVKEVEVSHWGHLSVEEHVTLVHSGARLKGGFSRLDFQRNPGATPSQFRQLVAVLPASAHSLYYRDVIGNISTSRAFVHVPEKGQPFTKLDLFTRYLMLGGWRTKFYYGYAAPLSESLSIARDGRYVLSVPFGTPIQSAVVDHLTTRFVLPEGVSDVAVSGVDATIEQSLRPTYLDTTGRVVVTLTAHNVVGANNKRVTVTYRYSSSLLYQDVLLLAGGVMCVFLVAILAGRVRLTIGKHGQADALLKETVLELSLRLHAIDGRLRDGDNKSAVKDLRRLAVEAGNVDPRIGEALSSLASQVDAAAPRDKKKAEEISARLLEVDRDLTSKL